MKTCSDCHIEIATGMHCPRCGAIATLWSKVQCYYHPKDLEDLSRGLRSGDIGHIRRERPTARMMLALLHWCEVLAPEDITPDGLRISLSRKIDSYLAFVEKVKEYEEKNGPGSYRKSFSAAIGEALETLKCKAA